MKRRNRWTSGFRKHLENKPHLQWQIAMNVKRNTALYVIILSSVLSLENVAKR